MDFAHSGAELKRLVICGSRFSCSGHFALFHILTSVLKRSDSVSYFQTLLNFNCPLSLSPCRPPPLFSSFSYLSSTNRGPVSQFQQRTILKVYQQLLVNPSLLLCFLLPGFPILSLWIPARQKGELCHGPVEGKWRNSSHAVSVITLPGVKHPASDYKRRIHTLLSPCHRPINGGIKQFAVQ